LKKMKQTIAIFPGSFDPFTLGHKSIVDRGLEIFGKIIIAIGYNEHKLPFIPIDSRKEYIEDIYNNEPRVEVCIYQGLTTTFAQKCQASAILRGVRTFADFEYERNLADVNRQIGGIETVFLLSAPEYSAISSSMIRELVHFGYNPSSYLPKPIDFNKSNYRK